mmetsp:Transcript_7656/g.15871  ORF Transcript_7656/g.15871 Transcript_7656/m.15871 type:complete len:264 (-) Transcript_7656:951-1742(-)
MSLQKPHESKFCSFVTFLKNTGNASHCRKNFCVSTEYWRLKVFFLACSVRNISLPSHHEANLVLDVVLSIFGHTQVFRSCLGGSSSDRRPLCGHGRAVGLEVNRSMIRPWWILVNAWQEGIRNLQTRIFCQRQALFAKFLNAVKDNFWSCIIVPTGNHEEIGGHASLVGFYKTLRVVGCDEIVVGSDHKERRDVNVFDIVDGSNIPNIKVGEFSYGTSNHGNSHTNHNPGNNHALFTGALDEFLAEKRETGKGRITHQALEYR